MNFVNKHPWMTFFLGVVALGTIGNILGPKPTPIQMTSGNLQPPPGYRNAFVNGRWMWVRG